MRLFSALVTFTTQGGYSATACISKCSAYRRERGCIARSGTPRQQLGAAVGGQNNVHFSAEDGAFAPQRGDAIAPAGCGRGGSRRKLPLRRMVQPAAKMQKSSTIIGMAARNIEHRRPLQLHSKLGKMIFTRMRPFRKARRPDSYLEKGSSRGSRCKRYPSVTPEVHARLMRELKFYQEVGTCRLFLLVLASLEEARRAEFPAVARGSEASSMVSIAWEFRVVCQLRLGSLLRTVF